MINAKKSLKGTVVIGKPNATVELTEVEGGHKIKVTDPNGVQELVVMDGPKGDKGDKGDTGERGATGPQGPAGAGVTSWNDLTDRPFYIKITEEEELLPEQTLEITSTKLDPDPVYDELLSKCTAGDKLLVTINGESTETEVRTYQEDSVSIDYIGNLSVFGSGSNTGEPFLIAKTASDETAFLQHTTLAKGNYTIRVVKILKEIVKVPEELLPDNVGGGAFVVDLLTEDGNNFTMVQDYEDVFNASLVGPVVGIVNIGGAMVFHMQFAIAGDNAVLFWGQFGGSGLIGVQIDGTTKTGTAQSLA